MPEGIEVQQGGSPRILHVVTTLSVGGLEVGLVDLMRGLHEWGVTQAVCCLGPRGLLADQLPQGIPVWSCSEGRRWRWQRPEVRAARLFKEYAPDVVHAENTGPWVNAGLAWLLAGRRGRLAFTMHGWEHVGPLPWRHAFLCRQLARITAGITAVSPETAKTFAAEIGIPSDRVGILSLGVDTERFHPRESGNAPNEARSVVFGCLARLSPIKGHEVLLDAVGLLCSRGMTGFEVWIVGDGSRREELQVRAAQLGLNGHVRFLGMCRDAAEKYRAFDVFVLPSHREGRPLTVMEAMASGLPVIASRVGSIPELLGGGEAGTLVDPGKPEQLADAMAEIMCDPELRQRQARAARARAERHLSRQCMIAEYLAFYRALVDGTYSPQSSA